MAPPASPKHLLDNYCSCVLQVKAREGLKGATAKTKGKERFPYAVCAKSVYQTRGKRGAGALACRFTKEALRTYNLDQLRGWLMFEGVKTKKGAERLSKKQAVDVIHNYLKNKEPKYNMRIATVNKRQSPIARIHRGGGKKSPQHKK